VKPISVVLDVRDRVTTAEACLRTLFEHSPPLAKVIVVVGSVMPDHLWSRLRDRFGDRVALERLDRPVSQAEARAIGLEQVETELAVVMDLDVFVRPGWLEPLVERQAATGAAVVGPLVLEEEHVIHAAGNDFLVDECQGKKIGHKELRFGKLPFHDASNLRPARVDFVEYHCMLVDVAAVKELGAFDPVVSHELQTAMILAAAGREVWVEPASVVLFHLHVPPAFDDLPAYRHYFDPERYLSTFTSFEARWGIDPGEEGRFLIFLRERWDAIPLVAELIPTPLGYRVGTALAAVGQRTRGLAGKAGSGWHMLRGAIEGRRSA
jgi:hypothetical protein